jgi:PAS domain S-box-containing protein
MLRGSSIKREYKVIYYGFLAILVFWLVDALVDYFSHHNQPYWKMLLLNKAHVSFRLLASLFFIVFSLLMAKVLSKQRRAEETLLKEVANRRHAEERLKLFSQAVEEAMDGIQITDLDGYIVYSNKAVQEIYGFSFDEFIGKHVNELNADPGFAQEVIIPSIRATGRWSGELMVIHKEGREFPIWLSASMVKGERDQPVAMVGVIKDMTRRKEAEKERESLISELQAALAKIKTLTGLLPICAWCKKVHDDKGYWKKVETYVEEHSEALFTHGICPDCLKKVSPEMYEELANDPKLSYKIAKKEETKEG